MVERRWVILLLLLCAPPVHATAQTPLEVGQRVRAWSSELEL